MRIGIYARVSTQRQAQADGLAQQLERLQAHAGQHGWTVAPENVFRDDGYSGARSSGPDWSGCGTVWPCGTWMAS
jgi:site-specific DNA recombinase